MSLTPQESARASFSQGQPNPPRHVFTGQPQAQIPNQSRQPPGPNYPRSTQGIRPQGHQPPYSTPYSANNGNVQGGVSRQNGTAGISAEQQIAQGVLSNVTTGPGSGSSTPQRRPPPLGTSIHIPNGTQPAIGSIMNQIPQQRNSHNASPALLNLNSQRQSMNHSPINNNMPRPRPQENDAQTDMSMIDPQLAIDQQLTNGNDSMLVQSAPTTPQVPVAQGDMLSPPPGGSYPTFEALFAAAQSHALAHGYAFVIGRSKRDNRGLKKVFLICDRGGSNKEKVAGEHRQRKTKSRKCGCEFGVFGLEGKTAWLLRGRIDGEHLVHNHPPSESPTEHPGARKLDPKAIAAVKALEENGVSVKETLEILHRENPNVRYLPRDIYNARAAIKRDPGRVDASQTEQLPTFYKKPPMTFEEKLRAELRTEVAKAQQETQEVKEQWKKEVEELREELRSKDKMIKKFETFIDICNERVMIQRERLATEGEPSASS